MEFVAIIETNFASDDDNVDSDCSLIRFHIVCFHDNILSEEHLNICSRRIKPTTF